MPEPSAPSATTAAIALAGGGSDGSCARPNGAIMSAPAASWPIDTWSGGSVRTVRPAIEHGGGVAERGADHRERADELAALLDADEERDAEEADADPDEPRPADALRPVDPRREEHGEDRRRRLDHRRQPGVDLRLGEAEQPERAARC